MAKKQVKKSTGKTSKKTIKTTVAKKTAKATAASKTAAKAPATVNVGLHGMARLFKMMHEAGLEAELNEALKGNGKGKVKIVKVDRTAFKKLKNFVGSQSQLAGHPVAMELSDCDPDDDFDICFGKG